MAFIFDITPVLSERSAAWPGDAGFLREAEVHATEGGPVEVGRIASTLHIGAHADAPSHYLQGAPGIDQVDPAAYLGPCQVIELRLEAGARILPEHLSGPVLGKRVLFKTGSHPDKEIFREDFNSLSVELVIALKQQGCLLVGIDTPSVDPFASTALEAHRALGACDIRVLEGLDLQRVPAGRYFLSALPLRIEHGDGSPVRAVLLDDPFLADRE